MASAPAETSNLATAKTVLSAAASIAATVVLVRSVFNDLVPHEIQYHFCSGIRNLFGRFNSQMTMVIDEFDGLVANQIYEAAEIYLGGKVSPAIRRLKVSKPEKENNLTVTVERDETVIDVFNGVKMTWTLICRQIDSRGSDFYNPRDRNSTLKSEVRSFELTFHKKHLDLVLKSYLPSLVARSKAMKQEKKTLKIFAVDSEQLYNIAEAWIPTNLDHPATFETLALDAETKAFILNDLNRFVSRRDYYRKVGKAWKRGYLLHGPPGTGKSSLIAAMANYLRFDVYDLELTELRVNSDLKKLLMAMANRSILVIEDIDCTVDFEDRKKASNPEIYNPRENQVTLSGLLNFIDGLWSSCGDERIIIFTTNHKEKLDPALLRPGRMDVHIHMSYCTPGGFRTLASNYIGVKDHALFTDIDHRLLSAKATPAEIAEELIKSGNPDVALKGLIEFLDAKKKENEEALAKKEREEKEKAEKQEAEGGDQSVGDKGVETQDSVKAVQSTD